MRRVIAPLELMGARIESTGDGLPLTVHGAPLRGDRLRPDVPSAQVKSAVLLAGLQARGHDPRHASRRRRAITRSVRCAAFGVDVTGRGLSVYVAAASALRAGDVRVPGDFSSAAFWMVAAAGLPGSDDRD